MDIREGRQSTESYVQRRSKRQGLSIWVVGLAHRGWRGRLLKLEHENRIAMRTTSRPEKKCCRIAGSAPFGPHSYRGHCIGSELVESGPDCPSRSMGRKAETSIVRRTERPWRIDAATAIRDLGRDRLALGKFTFWEVFMPIPRMLFWLSALGILSVALVLAACGSSSEPQIPDTTSASMLAYLEEVDYQNNDDWKLWPGTGERSTKAATPTACS